MQAKASWRMAAAALCFVSVFSGTAQAREFEQSRTHYRDAYAFAAARNAPRSNTSSVSQQGSGNGAAITQTGVGNSAGIRQIGANNSGAITQTGSNNNACLIQLGRNLDASIVQTGDNQSVGVLQTRRGVREIPVELCSMSNGRRVG